MPLNCINIKNFRLYENASFNLNPQLNLIVGDNASGKTSFLEAIYVLSTGKSFRNVPAENLVRNGAHRAVISAEIGSVNERIHAGISIGSGEKKLSLNGSETKRIADLAKNIPVLAISPDSHFLFSQSPKNRRSTLDWILFHVEQDFGQRWNRYQKTLQQRNASLRAGEREKLINAWTIDLAVLGESIHQSRVAVLSRISVFYKRISEFMIENNDIDITLLPGWNPNNGLLGALQAGLVRDRESGFTHNGPHKNDLQVLVGGRPICDHASHGQNKLLVSALRLAQIEVFRELTGRTCLLLIDDLSAELDVGHREKFLKILSGMNTQTFITATDQKQICTAGWGGYFLFHVEQGRQKMLEKQCKSVTTSNGKVLNFPS